MRLWRRSATGIEKRLETNSGLTTSSLAEACPESRHGCSPWQLGERPGEQFGEGGICEIGWRRAGKAPRHRLDFGLQGITPHGIPGLGGRPIVAVGALQFRGVRKRRERRGGFVGKTEAGRPRPNPPPPRPPAAEDWAHPRPRAPPPPPAPRPRRLLVRRRVF